ncbi:putative alternative oxidase [Diaporthe ampelina]|uniref:Putative alternative oxidase n=1 Tax=Diaporthe ampelina TaxID=1214573 RepID=A0A0G2FZP5_9PEZI|nr:putative alternative oxidase [Diaporthe ampelina]
MLCQDRPWVAAFFMGALLITIWSTRLIGGYDGVAVLLLAQDGASKHENEAERAFVRQAIDVEFPTPIDYTPIREICTRTPSNFRPGLLFTCEGQHGGIGMLRNQILKCVRYAISGGGALVVPSIALRNPSDLTDIETTNEVPLDYLLDREAFVRHLTQGCPGLRVYERAEDFPAYERRVEVDLIGDQFEPDHPREGLRFPREWRRFFDEWLEGQFGVGSSSSSIFSPDAPVHVRMGQSFLEYPVHDDGDAFAREFGKVLSFRNDTRAMAAKVLWELKSRFALPIDPATAISPGAFYGAHLRLEEDAVWAWPPEEWRYSRVEEQFREQLENLARTGLRVVYVASGDQSVVDLFAERLRASDLVQGDVAVVTKYDLLRGPDRERLESLTFDQQALVDFLIMFKASAFMGVAHSSFPWNVALRRHEVSKYSAYGNEGSDLLRDEYSIIMGMRADYPHVDPFEYGIWP